MQAYMETRTTRTEPASQTRHYSDEEWVDAMMKKGQNEPWSVRTKLTPALAKLFLSRNPDNRKISDERVKLMIKAIEANKWELNGEPIIISLTGEMNDGQHRCAAVERSGKSIMVMITFGISRKSRLTVDQGVARTVGHYLGMERVKNPAQIAQLNLFIMQYLSDGRLSKDSAHKPLKEQQTERALTHLHDLEDSFANIPTSGCGPIGGKPLIAFCHWAIARASNKDAADNFIRSFASGADLPPDSPLLYARNRLAAKKDRLVHNEKAELIFRAWNAYRREETPKTLILKNDKLPPLES